MLSVNPQLTPAQIENVLKSTADPIADANSFPGQLGAGRINAYAAVYSVAPRISGSNFVCYNGNSFKLENPPAGTITWTLTGPFSFSNTANLTTATGNPVTVYRTASNNSIGTLKASINNTEVANLTITPCQIAITNPSPICGSTADFSILNLPSNITDNDVTWTHSSNLVPQGGNKGKTKRFTVWDRGAGWVKATIAPLNNLVLERNTSVETFPETEVHPTVTYTDKLGVRYINPDGDYAITTYRWEAFPEDAVSHFTDYYGMNNITYGRSANAHFSNSASGLIYIYGYGVTGCGEASLNPSYWRVFYVDDRSPSSSEVVAFPNPASDILTIELGASSTNNAAKRIVSTYNVRLYNILGDLVHSAQTKDSRVEFNVATLPNGIYYLHIYDGISDAPEVQKVIVRR